MPKPGKLELTLKINEFPADVKTLENGWREFDIDTGEQLVTITVKPKILKKLEQAQESYPEWVAAIAGKMGQKTDKGFVLDEPNIQTFEKKSKATAPTSHAQAETVSNLAASTQSQLSQDMATQTKLAFRQNQTESVDAADKSVSKSQDKTAPSAKASTGNSVQPKSKKIGKFNVQIR
jgi:hypothetical protein